MLSLLLFCFCCLWLIFAIGTRAAHERSKMNTYILQFPGPAPASTRELVRQAINSHREQKLQKHWQKRAACCQAGIDQLTLRIDELNRVIARMKSCRVSRSVWAAVHSEHDRLTAKRSRLSRRLQELVH